MTQEEMVLNHLKENGKITSWTAIKLYGITRLSAKIYNLRADGHKIVGIDKTVTNRYGKKTSIREYVLKEDENGND